MIDELDRERLAALVSERDTRADDGQRTEPAYLQGRIDEYCAQNAIDQTDVPDLDLRLGTRG